MCPSFCAPRFSLDASDTLSFGFDLLSSSLISSLEQSSGEAPNDAFPEKFSSKVTKPTKPFCFKYEEVTV